MAQNDAFMGKDQVLAFRSEHFKQDYHCMHPSPSSWSGLSPRFIDYQPLFWKLARAPPLIIFARHSRVQLTLFSPFVLYVRIPLYDINTVSLLTLNKINNVYRLFGLKSVFG